MSVWDIICTFQGKCYKYKFQSLSKKLKMRLIFITAHSVYSEVDLRSIFCYNYTVFKSGTKLQLKSTMNISVQ